jgi:hypothetical protein
MIFCAAPHRSPTPVSVGAWSGWLRGQEFELRTSRAERSAPESRLFTVRRRGVVARHPFLRDPRDGVLWRQLIETMNL